MLPGRDANTSHLRIRSIGGIQLAMKFLLQVFYVLGLLLAASKYASADSDLAVSRAFDSNSLLRGSRHLLHKGTLGSCPRARGHYRKLVSRSQP